MIRTLRRKGRLYQARVRLDGWSHPRYFAMGVSDKRVAEQKLSELVRRLERQAYGLVPPDSVVDGAARPIADLLREFLGHLTVLGRSPATTRVYRVRIAALCRECGWTFLRDVTGDTFERWRRQRLGGRGAGGAGSAPSARSAELRRLPRSTNPAESAPSWPQGGSPKSVNDSLNGMRTFLRWCERKAYLDVDPLRRVERIRLKGDRNYRRALSAEQLAEFFESVPPQRAAVYRVAYYTGLRRKELNGLRRADFILEGANPRVRVPGSVAKNGRTQEIPLHAACVAILRGYWSSETPSFDWAFRGRVPKLETWRRDLERAGIPFVDSDGRRFDFHALRDTLCTHLLAAGVPLRAAMAIMRHSDPRLTMRVYTDERQLGVAVEVAKLPDLAPASAAGEAVS